MSKMKKYTDVSVYDASVERISYAFDSFEKVYVSFSGGKDSSVMLHLVMSEAIKRNRKVGVLIIDLEAQYAFTIEHINEMVEMYKDHIDLHWVCLPMVLRNAVTNYEPRWMCWEPEKKDIWVRDMPKAAVKNLDEYPFFQRGLEFEEFIVLWGLWYADGKSCGGFIGIRADESLNRFRTIAVFDKGMHGGKRYTTHIGDNLYNVYPIYDWRTEDIWRFHAKFPNMPHNKIYDLMHKAGVPLRCPVYRGKRKRHGIWQDHQARRAYVEKLCQSPSWLNAEEDKGTLHKAVPLIS
jgi:predicted phosphoadenosine phosphosulfate sulfurtransferase